MADLDALLADYAGRFVKADDHLASILSLPAPIGIGDRVRFNHLLNTWHVWNGVRWRPDQTRQVYDQVRIQAESWMQSDALTGEDRKAIMAIFDTGRKSSVLASLSAREGIAMVGNEFDKQGHLLGFENGIVDLRTGEFDPNPSPELLVSKSVGYDYIPDAPHDEFDEFLVSIFGGDVELIDYVAGLLGYSLFGSQREQKFWLWVGRGSNGKGILARTMVKVLGDYADTPADTMYMRNRHGSAASHAARPDLLRLQGLRFTYMSEPPGNQFNEELLKAHTGEDLILARNLYAKSEQMVRFSPTHKIIFLTNDPPKTDDVGVSMRRRVRVIRFDEDFTGERADLQIEERVAAQVPGIIQRLLPFARRWYEQGLSESAKVETWSEEYLADNDPLTPFLDAKCVIALGQRVAATRLYGAYEEYMNQVGEEPMTQRGFGLLMSKRFKKARSGPYFYLGIGLREDAEDD